jgi:hypothetical protein
MQRTLQASWLTTFAKSYERYIYFATLQYTAKSYYAL